MKAIRKLLSLMLILPLTVAASRPAAVRKTTTFTPNKFPLFTFQELITLSQDKPLPAKLNRKLTTLLHSVSLDNSAAPGSIPKSHLQLDNDGPAIRVAEWNIERGENFDWVVLALNGESTFRAHLQKVRPDIAPDLLDKVTEEAKILHQADILILNEVDLGLGRSGYHAVARDLAAALHMNFVYGVEFVEVDPLKLGTEELTDEDVGGDKELKAELEAQLKPDRARYKGLHGSAILSRYPISSASIQRLPVCHDWFAGEREQVAKIEQGKRLASDRIFLEKIGREIRRGGRMTIVANLKVDDVPGGNLTIVETHLEDKCAPVCRRKQMQSILESVKGVSGPVILSGDMNTTGADGSNLSLSYLAKSKATDYRFWGRQALMLGTPIPSFTLLNHWKNYNDPTATDIKFLADNKEAALFDDVQKFKFDDGGLFDFRGDPPKTVNNTGKTLANSNQRVEKGFAYTFALPRDFKGFVGRSRLDWLFIKPVYKDGQRTEILAPRFARTMMDLNTAPPENISDHAPITVDLPLTETQE